MTYPPRFSELYVISDIHMGGKQDQSRDFQVFHRGVRLANLVRHLTQQRPEDEVALALNGDIIDSLAEDLLDGYVALDGQTALRIMDRIYSRTCV